MKNQRIEVSLGFTKNLGDFQSCRLDATYGADIDDNDDVVESYKVAWEIVDNEINNQLQDLEHSN